nr:MAG TPA: hypothetical protein [Caudoviricetes sp.]
MLPLLCRQSRGPSRQMRRKGLPKRSPGDIMKKI